MMQQKMLVTKYFRSNM